MRIQEKVSEIITKDSFRFLNDKQFKEFSEYYKKLREAGIAKKEKYSIPLMKTIGPMTY